MYSVTCQASGSRHRPMTRKAWRWACWPWRVCGSQKAAARIAGAGQDAAGEQAEHREQAAQDDAAGQAEEDQQHAALGADTPGQARRERREQPQAEYRRGGQQAGGSGREAGIVAHLVEQGGEAGQRRAQVQRHQHQAQQEQPGA